MQHVEAGLVRGEPGALLLHPAERADRDLAVRLPAPRAAPVLELEQLARRLVHERLDRVLVAEPVAARRSCRRCAPRWCRPRRSRRPRRPRRRPCGCASGRPSTPRPRRGRGRSRRRRWPRAGRQHPPHQEHVVRAGCRGLTHPGTPRPPTPCRDGSRPCGGRCRRGTPRDGSGTRTSKRTSSVTRPCMSSVTDCSPPCCLPQGATRASKVVTVAVTGHLLGRGPRSCGPTSRFLHPERFVK